MLAVRASILGNERLFSSSFINFVLETAAAGSRREAHPADLSRYANFLRVEELKWIAFLK